MEQQYTYNEDQWIEAILLLSDIQSWLKESEKSIFFKLPISCKRKLLQRHYYLSCHTIAHILKRHYFKISRYLNCGKFVIPVADLVACIREASNQMAVPMPNSIYQQRVLVTVKNIGIDKYNQPVNRITVLTDPCGNIITAFPGIL